MKIGIFGGTFDPVHLGHLRVAEEAREGLGLSEVWFIPAGTPPHKRDEPHLPFSLRFELVRLATRDHPAFRVLDLEGKRPGPSYTVQTLTELRGLYPEHEFFFILGLDAFLEIETWYRYRQLPELAHLVVVSRGDLPLSEAECRARELFPGKKIFFLPVTRLDISSTEIRRRLRAGLSVRYLVPDPVLEALKQFSGYNRSDAPGRD